MQKTIAERIRAYYQTISQLKCTQTDNRLRVSELASVNNKKQPSDFKYKAQQGKLTVYLVPQPSLLTVF